MSEEVILKGAGVMVSNSRVILGGTTYSLRNITSVRTSKSRPSYAGPTVLVLLAAVCLFSAMGGDSTGALIFGIVALILGVIWATQLKPIGNLIISSASGEVKALTSKDLTYVQKIARAINDAIAKQ